MGFLSSIGSLLEGSGLRKVLETVYAPVSLGQMSSVKVYSLAIRGHFLPTSALLSIMLEEFGNKLNTDEKNDTKKMHGSDNQIFEDVGISAKSQKELSKNSRTSALWLYHTRYIFIVQ